MASDVLVPLALLQRGADQGISEGTAIIIGVVLGAGLQALATLLQDFLASRREERRAIREDKRGEQQWKREDQIRKEEQEQEEKRRWSTDRVQAYSRFAAATAIIDLVSAQERAERLARLNETHAVVAATGSSTVISAAGELYESAYRALLATDTDLDEARGDLDYYTQHFWSAIAHEQEQEQSKEQATEMPSESLEPRSSTPRPPWWRRMFGG